MSMEHRLRKIIQEIIEEELEHIDEMSTTGDVAGYNVPTAFRGNVPKNIARIKGISQQLGYTITKRGEEDLTRRADNLHEGGDPYYAWARNEEKTPTQKIAIAISEMNKTINEIGKVIRRNRRLQNESGVASEALYRRTQAGLLKLENRLLNLAGQVREMRGT